MTAADIAYIPAAELARLIRARKLSPVEVTAATLARAEASQPVLNAFITICREQAMAAARAAEQAVMRGEALGPLHGVPMHVKDLVNTAGVRTTYASYALEHNVPKEDAVAVARLKAAGAILIGKTTTPEFGHKPLTEAPLFGRTRNAWSAGRTSGGSSGGAAVAVAAGIAPLAVATDGGGSTRIPAACNGVVGFKQSLGLVPNDTVPDAFGQLTYTTPTTRTVMDTALMLEAMAGWHPSDPHSFGMPTTGLAAGAEARGDLAGLRIAWRPRLGNTAVAGDVLAACERALAAFRGLKAEITEPADDFVPDGEAWHVMTFSYWNTRFRPYVAQFGNRMSETLLRQMDMGRSHTAEELHKAIFLRTSIYRQVQGWFESADFVATPTLSRTALPIDHDFFAPIDIDGRPADTVRKAWYPYTHPFNVAGNPAVSLPCGFAGDGLPVAIQLIGRRGEDARLLRAAALFESAMPWADRRPKLPELDGAA